MSNVIIEKKGDSVISRNLTHDEWVRTGDFGSIDEDRFIWIKGRLKDVIKKGGTFIYAQVIEKFCRTKFNKDSFAVIGFQKEKGEDSFDLFFGFDLLLKYFIM